MFTSIGRKVLILMVTSFFILSFTAFTSRAEESRRTLSIMGINIEQYPAPLGRLQRFHRSSLLVQAIHSLPQEPDVLCIQEAWSKVAKDVLAFLLNKSYPYRVLDKTSGKYGWGGNSGLMILSKYPIVESRIMQFSQFRGEENLARKGVLGAKLRVGEKNVYIFTTHMQAGGNFPLTAPLDVHKPSLFEVKLSQVKESQDFIGKWMQKDPQGLAFFVGDFNIDYREPLYTSLKQIFKNVRDTFNKEVSPVQGSTWTDAGGVKDERIDFIFSVGGAVEGFSIITDRIGLEITDHLATFGLFQI